VQHALRAFTAADRKTIKQAAENFPVSDFYKTDELLTQLGIGEALVTLLNEKGIPTPLVHTLLCAPRSRMDVLTDAEIDQLVAGSKLATKYAKEIDSDSAYEILTRKLEEAAAAAPPPEEKPAAGSAGRTAREPSFFDNPVVKQVGRTAASVITRSLLGALGLTGRSRKR
jgi:predicted flap endonuclease-1-like 5' DNA nuclease